MICKFFFTTTLPLLSLLVILTFGAQLIGSTLKTDVLTVSGGGYDNTDVYIADVYRSLAVNVSRHLYEDVWPNWSTNGEWLVYQTLYPSHMRGEIYLLNFEKGINRYITDGFNPVVSNDGKIAYVVGVSANDTVNFDVFVADTTAGHIQNVTQHVGNEYPPLWVSDNLLAFNSDRDGNMEIYLLDLQTLELRNLTNSPGDDVLTDVDEHFITFHVMRPYSEFYVLDLTTDSLQLISDDVYHYSKPQLSPGGIVTFEVFLGGTFDVYIYDIKTGVTTNVSNHPSSDYSGVVSSNGTLAFISERGRSSGLYLCDLHTQCVPRPFSLFETVGNFVWMP